jgi:hypothetical protein
MKIMSSYKESQSCFRPNISPGGREVERSRILGKGDQKNKTKTKGCRHLVAYITGVVKEN